MYIAVNFYQTVMSLAVEQAVSEYVRGHGTPK